MSPTIAVPWYLACLASSEKDGFGCEIALGGTTPYPTRKTEPFSGCVWPPPATLELFTGTPRVGEDPVACEVATAPGIAANSCEKRQPCWPSGPVTASTMQPFQNVGTRSAKLS